MHENSISVLPQLGQYRSEVADLCRRYHIRKLALFGSVLRADFRVNSDIDVLVEFDADAHVGWEFIDIQDELSKLFGRSVDLHTPNSLSRHFREDVIRTAETLYERTRSDPPARHALRSATSAPLHVQ